MTPPNEENAQLLHDAIAHVDYFAPDVDEQIDRILPSPYISMRYSRYVSIRRVEAVNEEEPCTRVNALEEYQAGRMQVWDADFDSDEPIYDNSNRRWVKCKNCGAIKRDDEMVEYGGKLSVNKGTCRSCKQ